MRFKKFNTYNKLEIDAALKVLRSGKVSSFVGEWNEEFYGGKYVKMMEKKYSKFFKVKYAISVNSWSTGLVCALGALDLNPGDEVILPTFTMSACASAILHWNCIPIFADIDEKNLCIDINSIKKNISTKTRAIMAVDICGVSSNINEIKKLIKNKNIKIISDSAQAPFANYKNKIAGTLVDIGGISLNYHKHIHTGEGGVVFTNKKIYSEKIKMIRNHAEAVMRKRKNFPLINMIGSNYRMGEIEAAIAMVQLKKLKEIIKKRIKIANYMTNKLSNIDGLILPKRYKDNTNVYYTYPIILDEKKNFDRQKILNLLKKEGVEGFAAGYQNLHLLPIFQKKIAYGKYNFPWKSPFNKRKISYKKGICPVAEKLHDKIYMPFGISNFDLSLEDVDFIYSKFLKIFSKKNIFI